MPAKNDEYGFTVPASDFRQRAEQFARDQKSPLPEHLESVSLENFREVLRELHTRQIELERQNEELRHTQTELKAAQNRYFELYNLAPVGYFTLAESGLILETNLTASTLLGLSPETMTGQLITQYIFKDDQDRFYFYHKKLIETGKPQSCEIRMVKTNSTQFWAQLETTATTTISLPGGKHTHDKPVCRVVMSDITGRKLAAELTEKRLIALTQPLECETITFTQLFKLADVQRLQDEFAAATGVASLITHPDGTPLTTPSNFTHLCNNIIRKTNLGCANCYKSDASIGRYHPEGPIVQPCLSGGLWDAGASITVGGHHVANWLIGQVRDETQTEDKMRAYARDIGADETAFLEAFRQVPAMSRKRFDEIAKMLFTFANQLSITAYQNIQQARFIAKLERTEEALRLKNLVFDTSLAANFISDLNGIITEVNERVLKIWDYPDKSEVIGKPVRYFLMNPNDADVILTALNAHGQHEGDFSAKKRDGSLFLAHCLASIVKNEQGQSLGYQASVLDITERIRTEAELQKAQKLTSIGILAGGIAHDFNNILMGVFGNISLATQELSAGHPAIKLLKDAGKSMTRAILLTKQLLTFSKGGDPVIETINLGPCAEETARLELSGSNVLLIFKQEPDLWMAKADRGQIQQVISNLTTNAKEAMPTGGHLYISLENAEIRENVALDPPQLAKYIKITVRDEGPGIDSNCIDRIFDPYYTTKQSGRGLGLATAYSILKKHGGHIGVISEMGKGTTFTLYLPASGSPPPSKIEISPPAPLTLKHNIKLLVLDDEEFIRMVIPRWLKPLNCSVETSSDGRQTIDLYKQALQSDTPFDLLILDLTIPGGIGGQEVINEILAMDPNAKAIVSSGYAEGPIMANFTQYGFKGVLAKPYNEEQLQESVKLALRESGQ